MVFLDIDNCTTIKLMPLQTFSVPKNNNNNTRRGCGICFKHNKDPDSCPSLEGNQCITIAGFQCGYCKGMGHTIKHCLILKSNQKVQENREKDKASWKLLTLDEYRARGAKINQPEKIEASDDGFTVVKGRGSKKPQEKSQEPISKPRNAFEGLPEVKFEAEVLPVKPAAQTEFQVAAATAWGGFVSRKPEPEDKPHPLDQIADRWIEEANGAHQDLKTGATTFAKGKSWADLESDIESDDDSWFN